MKALFVKVSIESQISDADTDAEYTKSSSEGKLRSFSDGSFTLSYKISSEGGEILCKMTVENGKISLTERGGVFCDMVFESGVAHSTLYSVGPYSFDMEILADSIDSSLSEDGGYINLSYSMTVGGVCRFSKMKIEVVTLYGN